MHVLLVEDDRSIAENVKTLLEANNYVTSISQDKQSALELIEIEDFDIILLDSLLPDGLGEEVIVQIRSQKNGTPIIMLTAKNQIDDITDALSLGADDYITKPFAISELLARIKAVLRRTKVQSGLSLIEVGELRIDTNQRRVWRNDVEIHLAPKEYAMLEYLASRLNIAVERMALLHHVWGDDVDQFSNTVDVHIRYLRKKIDEPFSHPLIHTVKNVGYMLCAKN